MESTSRNSFISRKYKCNKSKKDNFCVQEPSGLGGSEGTSFYSGTEDCLYIDIKAQQNLSGLLPVMFWIHGGGNTTGLKDI